MLKKIRYIIEAFFLCLLFAFSFVLPQKIASNIGGFIGRNLGKKMAVSRKACRNIKLAFPEKSKKEIDVILNGMWDNLGRTIFEYPHLKNMNRNNAFHCYGLNNLKEAEKIGKPILFISAHLGNWEVLPYCINKNLKNKISFVYRAPNNPWSDKLLSYFRHFSGGKQVKKGPQGAKKIIKIIKDGNNIGLLFDQKMNEGLPIPLFGKLAMTITSIAQLGLKYDCTIVPCYCIRRNKNEFNIYFEDIFQLSDTKKLSKDIESNMRRLNLMLETWIKQSPEQWLWLHRRWPESQKQLKPKKKVTT